MNFQTYKKELLRIVLVTTPLFGFFIVAPILLYIPTRPPEELAIIDYNFIKVLLIILGVCGNILVQWGINLGLLQHIFSKAPISFLKTHKQRYIFSYALVLLYTFLLVASSDTKELDLGNFRLYPILGNLVTNGFILVLINLIIAKNEQENLKLEKAELEISQLIMQQEQLKQQIHPHFLFNALGTLQILTRKDAAKAFEYTKKLATFLRASLTLAQSDVIPVSEELVFLKNYLQLQQMRFKEAITYQINIPDFIQKEAKLPVFSLQTLAENAIKHNAFSKDDPLKIFITFEPQNTLWVSNKKSPKYTKPESGGIGLQNLTKRFSHFTEDLPYIEDSQNHFKVKLKLLGI